MRLAAHVGDAERDALRASLLEMVAARGLIAQGGGDHEWHYVIGRDGGQAVDADREAMSRWAADRPEIAGVVIGPLEDLTEGS